QPFKYRDKGSMATIGRHKAVVEVGPLKLAGIPAWYAWLWLHLFHLCLLLQRYRRLRIYVGS
ncbi:MAG: hypothetical protein EBW66_05705, partial [Actinobacteria bacterium]|nr:hypothetical protein [Actinomycetota bacterium]